MTSAMHKAPRGRHRRCHAGCDTRGATDEHGGGQRPRRGAHRPNGGGPLPAGAPTDQPKHGRGAAPRRGAPPTRAKSANHPRSYAYLAAVGGRARGTRSLEPKWHRRPLVSVYRLPSRHAWHCQASQTDRQEAAARMHAAPRPRGPGRGPRVRAGTSRAALHPERRSLLSAPPRATPDNDYSEAGPPALPCQPQLEPRRHRG